MIRPSDLTFVFQGGVSAQTRVGLDQAIFKVRSLAPSSEVVVSTARGSEVAEIDADHVVISDDMPSLPGNKHHGLPNNINRQIQSTRNGLANVTTPYAVKLRTDCGLNHLGFLDAYERLSLPAAKEPIVVCSLFTVDPQVFEQMPYHLSDWFQFGGTEVLRSYWACPFMGLDEAQHYATSPYAPHSNFLDRNFLARFAVEQHMAIHFARKLGYVVPRFHNDTSPAVLRDFQRFMAERVIVLDPAQIGLRFDKYEWAFRSEFQNLNCIGHLDWQMMREAYFGPQRLPEIQVTTDRLRAKRRLRKRVTRTLFRVARPLGPLLYNRQLRATVNRMLRLLAD